MEMMRFQSYCFQLKNGTPVFWKKKIIFQKICFKVKVFKMLKIKHMKKVRSSQAAILVLNWEQNIVFPCVSMVKVSGVF